MRNTFLCIMPSLIFLACSPSANNKTVERQPNVAISGQSSSEALFSLQIFIRNTCDFSKSNLHSAILTNDFLNSDGVNVRKIIGPVPISEFHEKKSEKFLGSYQYKFDLIDKNIFILKFGDRQIESSLETNAISITRDDYTAELKHAFTPIHSFKVVFHVSCTNGNTSSISLGRDPVIVY
ncbi:MAG: hypothetical protein EOO88_39365 [Pedobacter sp.]|nr:MAG: hypothetical protein EOO88_39365 [Pedobacter sp.]